MAPSREASPSPSQLPPIPGSPTYSYASTANPISSFNLPLPPPPRAVHAVLTKSDLDSSQIAYAELLTTAKAYRIALATLSTAASSFGAALESCARLKESRSEPLHPSGGSLSNSFHTTRGACTADSLLAASGVHQLIANHQQILSETVYRSFEVPLLDEIDGWRRRMEEEEVTYLRQVKERSKEIRQMEKEGLKLHRMRKRDVSKFRSHLVDLTGKLDGLTSLHGGHAMTLLRDSQDTSVKIVQSTSSLVRAEVDIFESLARKGWNGGGLDDLLDKGVDLFANDEDTAGDSSKLFSILPQKSILADADSARPGQTRSDSLLVEGDRFQSLAGAVDKKRADDSASIFSEGGTAATGPFNKSRGVRPFSPPPSLLRSRETQDSVITVLSSDATNDSKVSNASTRTAIRTALINGESSAKILTRDEEEKRGREERRWSVTDDGVVSDE